MSKLFPKLNEHFHGSVNLNYICLKKKVTGVHKSEFAKKTDSVELFLLINLTKYVVNNVVKKTEYNELVTKVNYSLRLIPLLLVEFF